MNRDLSMGGNTVTSSATPTANIDLTNKLYVDTQVATKANISGVTFTGNITVSAERFNVGTSNGTIILYGGSISPSNVNPTAISQDGFTISQVSLSETNPGVYLQSWNSRPIILNSLGNDVQFPAAPSTNNSLCNKTYVDTQVATKASVSGATFTGSVSVLNSGYAINFLSGSSAIQSGTGTNQFTFGQNSDYCWIQTYNRPLHLNMLGNRIQMGGFNSPITSALYGQNTIYNGSNTNQYVQINGTGLIYTGANNITWDGQNQDYNFTIQGYNYGIVFGSAFNPRSTVTFGTISTPININIYTSSSTSLNSSNGLNIYGNSDTNQFIQLRHNYTFIGYNNYIVRGIDGNYDYTFENFRSVIVNGAVVTSDKRIKRNIHDIEDEQALCIVKQLKPVQYEYSNKNSRKFIGFIAQDVEEFAPQFVLYTVDKLRTLDYNSIFSLQTKVIQYLLREHDSNLLSIQSIKDENTELKNRVVCLENTMDTYIAKNLQLEERITRLERLLSATNTV